MNEPKSLEQQHAEGPVFEEVEKIVDGLVSDIVGCRVSDPRLASAIAENAARQSAYCHDFDLALDALRVICPDSIKRQILRLAGVAMATSVHIELHAREEYQTLLKGN